MRYHRCSRVLRAIVAFLLDGLTRYGFAMAGHPPGAAVGYWRSPNGVPGERRNTVRVHPRREDRPLSESERQLWIGLERELRRDVDAPADRTDLHADPADRGRPSGARGSGRRDRPQPI
jgi:hypothetical protein